MRMWLQLSLNLLYAFVEFTQPHFPALPYLLGAMAETPKTEYVSARFRTLQGTERTLAFPRGAALGVFSVVHTKTLRTERERERERERESEWEANTDR